MATMTADEYREIVKAIINTATGGSANGSYPWNALNKGTYTAQDFYNLMQTRAVKNAGYDAVLNADGSVRTYTYINKNGKITDLGSYDDIVGAFNSNYQTGTASAGTVQFTQIADTKLNEPTETVSHSWVGTTGKLSHYDKGIKGAGEFVFGSVLPAIGAASTGIALGKLIDKGIYEVGTNIFGADNLEAFNPDTWKTITAGDDSLGAKAFNTIFGIDTDTGNTQMYLDENTLAYLTAYMGSNGFFDYNTEYELENKSILSHPNIDYKVTPIYIGSFQIPRKDGNEPASFVISNNASEVVCKPAYEERGDHAFYTFYSRNNFTLTTSKYTFNAYTQNSTPITLKDGSVIYSLTSNFALSTYKDIINFDYFPHDKEGNLLYGQYYQQYADDCSFIALFGEKTNTGGIPEQNDAQQFDKTNISDWNDISSVLNALKEQYPDLWNNRVENSVVQPDGTTKTYTYIPVPMATGGTADQPTTEGAKQSEPVVDPSTATDTLLNTLVQILTQTKPVGMTDKPTDPINPNSPDIGVGNAPIVPPVTGKASALYSIYNPTLEQVNSLGAWLWSSNFIDQLLKLFSSPMDAIIGLHKIYATPATGGAQNIKVGYLDSGVPSKIVTEQYTTVDCGTVNCYEYFGNVLDYNPYTNIRLYLPFIGIIDLSNSDVMRSNINVVYHVDVLSGACLAEVKITRDGGGGTLYQYAGNAATTLPISSGSYMGVVSSVSSVATRALAGFASGGALGAIASGATGLLNAQGTNVVHSGGFSGNAGAMGCKKPYLIIERPQTETADNTAKLLGYGSNLFTKLKTCKGLTRVKGVHVDAVPATKEEKKLIEEKLMDGIIIS